LTGNQIKSSQAAGCLYQMRYEDENVEFKAAYSDSILKEVIGFANAGGGIIYVGYNHEGQPVGLDDLDQCLLEITNSIRDNILPDATMHVKYEVDEATGTIKMIITEGLHKPYYFKSKGMKPEGVYIRQGASSAPTSMEQIRQLIKAADQDIYEEYRSLNQNLEFSAAEKEFQTRKVDFSKEKFVGLGIVNASDGLYTNLAMLLSDNCEFSIKAAVFDGMTKQIFKDRKEFFGSVFKQLRDTYEYLELCNRVRATFSGLDRIDEKDYPEDAFREALLNAIVHRDYTYSGSIIINVYDDRMEFVSIGGLVKGLTEKDIRAGISQTRNQNLAKVFYRLRLIEAYGTGIQRIFSSYPEETPPQIGTTENTFTMVLPNRNHLRPYGELKSDQPAVKEDGLSYQFEAVIEYLKGHGALAEADLQDLLGVKRTRAYLIAKQMQTAGLIDSRGRGAKKRYYLK
jgi:ATP-dependent DNA helicase RecG